MKSTKATLELLMGAHRKYNSWSLTKLCTYYKYTTPAWTAAEQTLVRRGGVCLRNYLIYIFHLVVARFMAALFYLSIVVAGHRVSKRIHIRATQRIPYKSYIFPLYEHHKRILNYIWVHPGQRAGWRRVTKRESS